MNRYTRKGTILFSLLMCATVSSGLLSADSQSYKKPASRHIGAISTGDANVANRQAPASYNKPEERQQRFQQRNQTIIIDGNGVASRSAVNGYKKPTDRQQSASGSIANRGSNNGFYKPSERNVSVLANRVENIEAGYKKPALRNRGNAQQTAQRNAPTRYMRRKGTP